MNDHYMPEVDHKKRIVILAGDGVGPEVMAVALAVLNQLDKQYGLGIETEHQLIGGAAFDATGNPLPDETIEACKRADAILLGAVGGPQWDGVEPKLRPEAGLLHIRQSLDLFCNLRPIVTHPALFQFSPIKEHHLHNTDFILVRELTGGIYFGDKTRTDNAALDTCSYTRHEIERVTRKACDLAKSRRSKLTLVDKANVLETSRLWREVVSECVQRDYPGLEFESLLVDAAAMHLLSRPADFDVILTENLFGDILSDEASMLSGSMGLLPSASLREDKLGLYEPVHGSAPGIAGKGIANPYAMLLSVAMMLRHSLSACEAANALEQAIEACWQAGQLSCELIPNGLSTAQISEAVCNQLRNHEHTNPYSSAVAVG